MADTIHEWDTVARRSRRELRGEHHAQGEDGGEHNIQH